MNLAARLKIILLIAAFIAAVVGVGLAARLTLDTVGPHPAMAQAVYWTIVPAAGLGASSLFGSFAPELSSCGEAIRSASVRAGRTTRSAMLQASGAGSRSTGFV
jgi:hypothetical protein